MRCELSFWFVCGTGSPETVAMKSWPELAVKINRRVGPGCPAATSQIRIMPKSFFTLMACEIIIEVCYKMFAADVAALIASAFNNNNERFLDTKQRRKLYRRKSQGSRCSSFCLFFLTLSVLISIVSL